jgi:XTP/dITP diphosphohydrolase
VTDFQTPVVVVRTGATVPPGLLAADAWDLLRARPVYCLAESHPQREALVKAGVDVRVLSEPDTRDLAGLTARAPLAWLAEPVRYGRPGPDAALVDALLADGAGELVGSADPIGARLLDAVAVMDRLRSPGGCPWDAEQTFESLKRYLIEEAYEAYETVEENDLDGLRDELGDVLLQVLFNARVAAEGGRTGAGWDIDDVAAGLVAKLVRRHPHVFPAPEDLGSDDAGLVAVSGAADVVTNWDVIKEQERREKAGTDPAGTATAPSPLAGVPMGMPALLLAAKLQSRAAKAGVGEPTPSAAQLAQRLQSLGDVPDDAADDERGQRLGEVLFGVVALARTLDVDAETALRDQARRFRRGIEQQAAGTKRG